MIHVRFPRPLPAFGSVVLILAGVVAGIPTTGRLAEAQVPPVAPPPPPIPNQQQTPQPTALPTTLPSSAPIPSASPSPSLAPVPTSAPPRGRRGRTAAPPPSSPSPEPEPSATPTSPAFSTLDGTWEVQLQYIDHTEYSYLRIVQGTAGAITGSWKVNGHEYPMTGTYDGRVIHFDVKEPIGTVAMNGYVDGATDMIGTVDLALGKADPTAFTAEHRAANKGAFSRS